MAGNYRRNSKLELRRPGEGAINLWDVLNKLVGYAIILGILFVVFLFFLPVLKEVRIFEKQAADKRQQLMAAETHQKRLLEEVELLKHDPEYNERIARERMGLARSNEVIFRFPPLPKPVPSTPAARDNAKPGQKSAANQ
ncbi:MAG: septum formation initiator family protein [Verrucomicrobiae bacterium]|nr:septum formation initiator family protein [Verrucomicrobiae bacterium]